MMELHRRGDLMRRLAVCVSVSLLSFSFIVPADAMPRDTSSQQTRAYRKAAKKAQKDMQRYSNQQRKAMKRSAKAQRKALKRAQQHGWSSRTGWR
jgi:hypothetical protein